ncbi:hypothetical protein diail_9490 [Diaporthe ilicicola]|nr:hypothetical protein diail_9490 [Diaporthe ilicicola]
MFDDSCINDHLFTPWVMDTPMQHSLDGGGSSSNSTRNPISTTDVTPSESPFSARSRSSTVAPPGQLPELSMLDTSLTLLLSPSATDSAADLQRWEGSHTAHSDMDWAIRPGGHGTAGSTPEPLRVEPWSKPRAESETCCCLSSSISFLERLVSRSASRQNRIDLLLADVGNSIETLTIFVACERCVSRAEQNMLLAMAIRQISVICGKMANSYKALHLGGLDNTDSSQQKSESDASAGPIEISVSTYRVNRRERLHLLGGLVSFQIAELQQHINTIKSRYRNLANQSQAEALIEAENNIKLAQVAITSHS